MKRRQHFLVQVVVDERADGRGTHRKCGRSGRQSCLQVTDVVAVPPIRIVEELAIVCMCAEKRYAHYLSVNVTVTTRMIAVQQMFKPLKPTRSGEYFRYQLARCASNAVIRPFQTAFHSLSTYQPTSPRVGTNSPICS